MLQSLRAVATRWVWDRLMDAISGAYDGDVEMIDNTSIRMHQQAATFRTGGRDHGLGRSRGGLTTKIHAVVNAQGLPIRLGLTAGQAPRQHPKADTSARELAPFFKSIVRARWKG